MINPNDNKRVEKTFYRLVYSNGGKTFAHVHHTLETAEYFRKDAVAQGCRDARIEVYSAVLKEVV